MHFVEHKVSKQRESLVIMLPIISLYVQLRLAYLFKWMNIIRFYVIVIYFGTRSYLLLLNARSWQKIDNKKVRSLALNFDDICYAAKVTKQSPSRITNTCLHFYGIRLKSTYSFLQASSTIAYKDDSWLRLLSYFFLSLLSYYKFLHSYGCCYYCGWYWCLWWFCYSSVSQFGVSFLQDSHISVGLKIKQN